MRKKSPGRKSRAAKETELNDLFAELRGEYLESFPEKFAAIRDHWQQGNRDGLHNEFHKMKGTGTTYGLPDVSKVAEILEEMCENDSPQLGMCVLLSLQLLETVCANYKVDVPYDMVKDPIFQRLVSFYTKMERAS